MYDRITDEERSKGKHEHVVCKHTDIIKNTAVLAIFLFFMTSLATSSAYPSESNSRRYVPRIRSPYRNSATSRTQNYRGFRHREMTSRTIGVRQTLIGPNVCGASCCKGWKSGNTVMCISPICLPSCKNHGHCKQPGVCLCRNTYIGRDCGKRKFSYHHAVLMNKRKRGPRQTLIHFRSDDETSAPVSGSNFEVVCTPNTCFNGGTCVDGSCVCRRGYAGKKCEKVLVMQMDTAAQRNNVNASPSTKVAIELCNRLCAHGYCIRRGGNTVCQCRPGYTGTMCESLQFRGTNTKPTSFINQITSGMKYSNNLLRPVAYSNNRRIAVPTPRISNTVASPYGKCYKRLAGNLCGISYSRAMTVERCCHPGLGDGWGPNCSPCRKIAFRQSARIETKASRLSIRCPTGFTNVYGICRDINECETKPNLCLNGKCVNSRGSYWCTCKRKYHLHESRSRCLPDKLPSRQINTRSRDQCYLALDNDGGCGKIGAAVTGSKAICCCSVGKAWGSNCNKCPLHGTVEYYKLCPNGPGYSKSISYVRSPKQLPVQTQATARYQAKPTKIPIVNRSPTMKDRLTASAVSRNTSSPTVQTTEKNKASDSQKRIDIIRSTMHSTTRQPSTTVPMQTVPLPTTLPTTRQPSTTTPIKTVPLSTTPPTTRQLSTTTPMTTVPLSTTLPTTRQSSTTTPMQTVSLSTTLPTTKQPSTTTPMQTVSLSTTTPTTRQPSTTTPMATVPLSTTTPTTRQPSTTTPMATVPLSTTLPTTRQPSTTTPLKTVPLTTTSTKPTTPQKKTTTSQKPTTKHNIEPIITSTTESTTTHVPSTMNIEREETSASNIKSRRIPISATTTSAYPVPKTNYMTQSEPNLSKSVEEFTSSSKVSSEKSGENLPTTTTKPQPTTTKKVLTTSGMVEDSKIETKSDSIFNPSLNKLENNNVINIIKETLTPQSTTKPIIKTSEQTPAKTAQPTTTEQSDEYDDYDLLFDLYEIPGDEIDVKFDDIDGISEGDDIDMESEIKQEPDDTSDKAPINIDNEKIADVDTNETNKRKDVVKPEIQPVVNTDHILSTSSSSQFFPTTNDHEVAISLKSNACSPNPCENNGECFVEENLSFKCECTEGYFGIKCETKDFCVPDACENGAACETGMGFYYCDCLDGFIGKNCDRTRVPKCQSNPCSHGACTDIDDSYECECDKGYQGIQCDQDVNECENEVCQKHAECKNTKGSFKCICASGFTMGEDDLACNDINECANVSLCENGKCVNNKGSYECKCFIGYKINEENKCEDLNECEFAKCGNTASCNNLPGGYVCECPNEEEIYDSTTKKCSSPYSEEPELEVIRKPCYSTPRFCKNILSKNVTEEECCCTIGRSWGECDSKQPCPSTMLGAFKKLCPVGRGMEPGENSKTVDLNECELFGNEKICRNGKCQNSFGGYECVCYPGFYYNRRIQACDDINECRMRNKCIGGFCRNTKGSFGCECPAGTVLRRSGYFSACTNTQARRRNPGVFSYRHNTRNAMQTNSPKREFSDFCYSRILRTGNSMCSAQLENRLTYKKCCCGMGVAWGSSCSKCPRKYTTDYTFLCKNHNTNLRPLAPPVRLDNVNDDVDTRGEIQEQQCGTEGCKNGNCLKTVEGFTCECNKGFRLDSNLLVCNDIDECKELEHMCENGNCKNELGSFRCECQTGFVHSRSDSTICITADHDIDIFNDSLETSSVVAK